MKPQDAGSNPEGPAQVWGNRLSTSEKTWETWDKDYQGDNNEKYYLGHQHLDPTDAAGRMKYVINLCFPSVEIKMPALLFSRPRIEIVPRPGIEDDPETKWDILCQLLRDLILTCITVEDSGFAEDVPLSVQETFYRYGVIEVGLSTVATENPNAPMLDVALPGDPEGSKVKPDVAVDPVLESITPAASLAAPEGMPVAPEQVEPPAAPATEPQVSQMVYYKRIPAKQFRVSSNSRPNFRHADWVGYYEYLNTEDLKRSPYYDQAGKDELEATHVMKDRSEDTRKEDGKHAGMTKVWTIWCNRSKMKYTFADGKEQYLKAVPFKGSPKLALLGFHPIMDCPYPLPPMFNWLSPQDELNETREMQRVHRRRGTRRFLSRKNSLTAEDKDKLRSSEDGIVLEVDDINNTIVPMLDAPLDRAVTVNVPLTKDDFRNISGVSGEQTGEADSPTATQANIVNVNSVSRDNYYKSKVAKWLSRIFKLTVEVLREEAAVPIWIKGNVDVDSPNAMQESALIFQAWQMVSQKDLGTFDFDVHVSIDSLNGEGKIKERQDWMTFLGTIFGEDAQSALAMSEPLLKKTMYLYDIRNGKDIQNIQMVLGQIAQMKAMAAAQEAAAKGDPGSGPSGGPNSRTPSPGPNSQDMNDKQLDRH